MPQEAAGLVGCVLFGSLALWSACELYRVVNHDRDGGGRRRLQLRSLWRGGSTSNVRAIFYATTCCSAALDVPRYGILAMGESYASWHANRRQKVEPNPNPNPNPNPQLEPTQASYTHGNKNPRADSRKTPRFSATSCADATF